jgi:hypothetical protein
VNARFLDRLFLCVKSETVRHVVLAEMISRSCKCRARTMHSKSELLDWFQNVTSVSILEMVQKKFPLFVGCDVDEELLQSLFDQTRFLRELGIRGIAAKFRRISSAEEQELETVETKVEPVISRMKSLSVLEQSESAVLMRGETIGKKSSSQSATEFKMGFLQVRGKKRN